MSSKFLLLVRMHAMVNRDAMCVKMKPLIKAEFKQKRSRLGRSVRLFIEKDIRVNDESVLADPVDFAKSPNFAKFVRESVPDGVAATGSVTAYVAMTVFILNAFT